MTVFRMVQEMLEKMGADGLCNPDCGCGCPVNDLMPCHDYSGDCRPARKCPVTAEMIEEGYAEEGDEYFFPLEETAE